MSHNHSPLILTANSEFPPHYLDRLALAQLTGDDDLGEKSAAVHDDLLEPGVDGVEDEAGFALLGQLNFHPARKPEPVPDLQFIDGEVLAGYIFAGRPRKHVIPLGLEILVVFDVEQAEGHERTVVLVVIVTVAGEAFGRYLDDLDRGLGDPTRRNVQGENAGSDIAHHAV